MPQTSDEFSLSENILKFIKNQMIGLVTKSQENNAEEQKGCKSDHLKCAARGNNITDLFSF